MRPQPAPPPLSTKFLITLHCAGWPALVWVGPRLGMARSQWVPPNRGGTERNLPISPILHCRFSFAFSIVKKKIDFILGDTEQNPFEGLLAVVSNFSGNNLKSPKDLKTCELQFPQHGGRMLETVREGASGGDVVRAAAGPPLLLEVPPELPVQILWTASRPGGLVGISPSPPPPLLILARWSFRRTIHPRSPENHASLQSPICRWLFVAR